MRKGNYKEEEKLVTIKTIKCEHELIGDITCLDWTKMPTKLCRKCGQHQFAYLENLQKNISNLDEFIW